MGPGLGGAVIRSLILASIALLVASLSGRRAFAAAFIVGVFVITAPMVGILNVIGGENSALASLSFIVNPMTLLIGVEQWLFGTLDNDPMPIGDYGPAYGVATLVLFAGCLSLLLLRYRKVAR